MRRTCLWCFGDSDAPFCNLCYRSASGMRVLDDSHAFPYGNLDGHWRSTGTGIWVKVATWKYYGTNCRHVARILHMGEGAAQKVRGCTFYSKRSRPFRSPELSQQWGPYIWDIWGPQNTTLLTSDRENSAILLNNAGPTSQQSQFFSVKNLLSRRLGGAWSPCPSPGYAPD